MDKQYLILFLAAILLLIVISISFLRLNSIEKKKHFVCSNCGKNLKISKYKMLVTRHYYSKLYFKCPFCNKKSWMSPEND